MHHREIPQFAAIPAVVCPGPLGEGERRVWQLVENLAREDLQPAELAAALLYERCAVLVSKLLDAGVAVPAQVHLDDPVLRWEALERLRVRSGCHQLGAPWEEVLRRLGIQMRAERAKDLVRAFKALPVELSADMDAHKVALATRMSFLRLDRGAQAAADELWAAVKARGRPELLSAAVAERLDHPDLDGDQAAERAEEAHVAANKARRAALSPLPRRTLPTTARSRSTTPSRRCAACSPTCARADSRLRTTPGPFGCSPRSCWPWCSHRPPPDERRDG